MSLTLYILCTLPMLVMLAIAFVDPQTGEANRRQDDRGQPPTTAPDATEPEPPVPVTVPPEPVPVGMAPPS